MVLYISNPLLLDGLKTFFDSNEIINDTSFNKNILCIETKGLIKILAEILDKTELDFLEKEFKKQTKLKDNAFSLIGNLNIESIFKSEVSFDPLKTAEKLLNFTRKTLHF